MNLPDPPKNSQIQTILQHDGITLCWHKSNGGPSRFFIVAFLAIWLCGWLAGFIGATAAILTEDEPTGFLVIWLIAWTTGGVFAGGLLYLLLRPRKPESVTMERNRFIYDTGSAVMNFFNPYWMMR